MYKAIILALGIAIVGSVSDWPKDEPLLYGKIPLVKAKITSETLTALSNTLSEFLPL